MLCGTFLIAMLGVVTLNAVVLNVVAPVTFTLGIRKLLTVILESKLIFEIVILNSKRQTKKFGML
jgi:hypothetical protein